MKKTLISLASVALVAALAVPGVALAAGNGNSAQQQFGNCVCAAQANFVDEDGDGLCDNQGQNCTQQGQGNGSCDGTAKQLRAHDGTGGGSGNGHGMQKRNCQ